MHLSFLPLYILVRNFATPLYQKYPPSQLIGERHFLLFVFFHKNVNWYFPVTKTRTLVCCIVWLHVMMCIMQLLFSCSHSLHHLLLCSKWEHKKASDLLYSDGVHCAGSCERTSGGIHPPAVQQVSGLQQGIVARRCYHPQIFNCSPSALSFVFFRDFNLNVNTHCWSLVHSQEFSLLLLFQALYNLTRALFN